MKRLAMFLCLLAVSLSPALGHAATRLTIVSGPVGGDWYSLGGALGDMIKQQLPDVQTTVTTGGGISNGPQVEQGKAQIGLSQAMLYRAMQASDAPYAGLPKATKTQALCYLGFVYQAYCLVKKDSPYTSLEQMLKNKMPIKLVTSTKASTPELAVARLLDEYGVTYKDIESWGGKVYNVGFAEAEGLISDGHCDVYMGPVLGSIVQMITTNAMRMLPWDEKVIDNVVEKFAYQKHNIPEGRYYFVDKPYPALCEANVLLARATVSEDIAYQLTRLIAENAEMVRSSGSLFASFKSEQMPDGVGGPLHPGAEKYYRERGWLK